MIAFAGVLDVLMLFILSNSLVTQLSSLVVPGRELPLNLLEELRLLKGWKEQLPPPLSY